MSSPVIVDTDILIDAARQVAEAIDCLNEVERTSALAISVVTEMELLIGCQNKTEQRNTERFLRRFQVLTLNEKACKQAVELLRLYRLSHGLLIPDAMIAATAMTLGHPMISKNQRDFRFISGLRLLSYPAPYTSTS
ncbi:MAG: type II toxin-antitoxin system VapC family toxin [Chloroflexi bacterium]|nr:type II toxin-antitoxin system VapC family toxin [Chloroflexota bacterium]